MNRDALLSQARQIPLPDLASQVISGSYTPGVHDVVLVEKCGELEFFIESYAGCHEVLAEQYVEIERLREALHPFAVQADGYDPPENDDDCEPAFASFFSVGDLRRARKALSTGHNTPAIFKTVGQNETGVSEQKDEESESLYIPMFLRKQAE